MTGLLRLYRKKNGWLAVNNLGAYICRGFNRCVVLPFEMKKDAGLKRTALVFSPDFCGHAAVEWRYVKGYMREVVDEIIQCCRSSVEVKWDRDKSDDAPLRVLFETDGELRCIMLTEFWCNVGGPFPYSDSYTFSFFTRTDSDDRMIVASLLKVMGKHKEITMHQIVDEAPRYSKWWVLLNMLRSLL